MEIETSGRVLISWFLDVIEWRFGIRRFLKQNIHDSDEPQSARGGSIAIHLQWVPEYNTMKGVFATVLPIRHLMYRSSSALFVMYETMTTEGIVRCVLRPPAISRRRDGSWVGAA